MSICAEFEEDCPPILTDNLKRRVEAKSTRI